jgi:saccharopine dehydrogenase (NAD+, L-lysine-forming)
MIRIGLIKEGKTPPDTRVPLTPFQCAQIMHRHPDITIVAEPSSTRCYTDAEYTSRGIKLQEDLSDCDILLGVKEVPLDKLIPGKTYFFFSHTKKAQAYNKPLMQTLIQKKIRMVDYECLTHADGQRILGFGFYAGFVGAHNGLLTYGKRTGAFSLPAANYLGSVAAIKKAYDGFILPKLKIVITGSGNVSAGAVEIMHLLDVEYIEPQDFLENEYEYPVYTHLKGHTLYQRKDTQEYHREDFHAHPDEYECLFTPFLAKTDILMNGVYWDKQVPRLFEKNDIQGSDYRMFTIADITCDMDGSVPINLGSSTIADPVYGVHRHSLARVEPFENQENIVDIMAVDNLPNELPRDASEYFGIHFEKYILRELLKDNSEIIDRGTICSNGKLMPQFDYLNDYAYGE